MLEDIIKERRRKLDLLKAAGVPAYPARAKTDMHDCRRIKTFSALAKSKKKISIAGRVMSVRDQGNLLFVDCADESGGMQCVLKKDTISNFKLMKSVLDRGDFISVTGRFSRQRKGNGALKRVRLKCSQNRCGRYRRNGTGWKMWNRVCGNGMSI